MKLKQFTTFLCLIIFFSALGTNEIYSQGKLSPKDIKAIKKIEKDFTIAWLNKDEKGVLDLFWDDAMLYANGRKPVKGIMEIKRVWFTPSETIHTLTRYDTKLDEVYGDNNLAYAIGKNDMAWDSQKKGKDEIRKFTAERHFLAIYIKRNGKWKILRRHWNGKLKEVTEK